MLVHLFPSPGHGFKCLERKHVVISGRLLAIPPPPVYRSPADPIPGALERSDRNFKHTVVRRTHLFAVIKNREKFAPDNEVSRFCRRRELGNFRKLKIFSPTGCNFIRLHATEFLVKGSSSTWNFQKVQILSRPGLS